MSKNKHKNQYGSFNLVKSGYQKYMRYLVTALLVVIFVVGAGFGLFNKFHKVQKAATVEAVVSAIPGWWNQQYFGASVCEKDVCKEDADPDKDGLTNFQEFYYHTNPLNAFTVKDKLNDGQLVVAGFDPSRAGHITFDQVTNPENLLGESLVFDKDIKQMVAESNDISKVNLQLVQDDQLQIVNTEDDATYKTYASKLHTTINKYFRDQDINNVKEILKSGSDAQVSDIKTKSEMLASELKTIPIPRKLLMFHKYNIVLFQLLSEIIPVPTDLSSLASDSWYDKVQAFLAVQQKLGFEEQALKQITGTNP